MNQRLPSLKAKEVIKALKKAGFVERPSSGKHLVLKHPIFKKIIPIPIHGSKDLKRGTLFGIIEMAGLSVKEFIDLL